jgi:hypothetical protein
MATGAALVEAVSLDSIESVATAAIDILKIDVDGFDGEVLAGAINTLRRCRPAVIFEWHPRLVVEAQNDPLRAFRVLEDCGYQKYIWFNNVGTFSHFGEGYCPAILEKQLRYLLAVASRRDEHFDIVALPLESGLDDVALAALDYARTSQQ